MRIFRGQKSQKSYEIVEITSGLQPTDQLADFKAFGGEGFDVKMGPREKITPFLKWQ